MAIFVLLTKDDTRNIYLPQMINETNSSEETENENVDKLVEQNENDKKVIYSLICDLVPKAKTILGDYLKSYSGKEEFWQDVEAKGKKYMIIKMQEGNYVRSTGKKGEKYEYCDNNKFIILDGIDYKSNDENDELLYMEV